MKLVAVCPGHYPASPGAINKKYNLTEHETAMQVVNILTKLTKSYKMDVIVGKLGHKVRTINSSSYDLAIDIHFNADAELQDTDDLVGYGCMVMHCPSSALRKTQAAIMSETAATYLNEKDLGAREGYYWGGSTPGSKPDYFLSKTNCPAFIPEFGFIDNNAFAFKFLTTNEGLTDIAVALNRCIENFLGQ